MDLDKSLEKIRELREELSGLHHEILEELDCDGCKKGPCIARIRPGEVSYAFRGSLFLHNGFFYLRGCSMARRKRGEHLPIEITNNDGVFNINAPTLQVKIENSVGPKDILIGKYECTE